VNFNVFFLFAFISVMEKGKKSFRFFQTFTHISDVSKTNHVFPDFFSYSSSEMSIVKRSKFAEHPIFVRIRCVEECVCLCVCAQNIWELMK
jgi:hypothetical protein